MDFATALFCQNTHNQYGGLIIWEKRTPDILPNPGKANSQKPKAKSQKLEARSATLLQETQKHAQDQIIVSL